MEAGRPKVCKEPASSPDCPATGSAAPERLGPFGSFQVLLSQALDLHWRILTSRKGKPAKINKTPRST